MLYALQSGWKKEGKRLHYYGLRKAPNTLKNNVRISAAESDIIDSLLYPPISQS